MAATPLLSPFKPHPSYRGGFGVAGAAWGQLLGAVALGAYSAYFARERILQKDAFPLANAQPAVS